VRVRGLVVVVVAITCAAPCARAGGLYFSDRGVRPLARGGAFVAGADDMGAMWYNPAGLADAQGTFLADASFMLFGADFQRQDVVIGGGGALQTYNYQPVHGDLDALKMLAVNSRPDLAAARQGIIAARSQESLAHANGKRDLDVSFNYSHVADINSGAFFFNMQIPVFDRNQGEIARTRAAITQSQELAAEANEQVMSDVLSAYESVHTNDQIINLYRSGYLDQTTQSRDISQYAYQRGATSLLDFLDAQRSYRANQLSYRQALANYMVALEQLREAVGTRSLP